MIVLTDSINCWFWVALLFFSPFVIIFRFSKNYFYFSRIDQNVEKMCGEMVNLEKCDL